MSDLNEKIEEYFEEDRKDTLKQLKKSPMSKIVRKRKLKKAASWLAAFYVAGTVSYFSVANWNDISNTVSNITNSKLHFVSGESRQLQEYFERAENTTDLDQKIGLYEKAYQTAPDEISTVLQLSKAYQTAGKPEKAFKILDEARKDHPDRGVIDYAIGISYANLQQYESAIAMFNKALSKGYIKQNVYDNSAAILIKAGHADNAIEAATYSMKKWGDTARNHTLRAIALEMKNDLNGAMVDYKTAMHLQPCADAYIRCYDLLMRVGQRNNARNVLNNAIALFPNEPYFKQIAR